MAEHKTAGERRTIMCQKLSGQAAVYLGESAERVTDKKVTQSTKFNRVLKWSAPTTPIITITTIILNYQ